MRTVKPQRLGVLHRTFELEGKFTFVPSVFVPFRFGAPDLPMHEAALWNALGEALGPGEAPVVFDEAMRKERPEVLVFGRAYAVGGAPTVATQVRLRFGDEALPLIDKRINVAGDRVWERHGPSEPAPFVSMPLSWDRAFGGEGFADNPEGRGVGAVLVDGREVVPLPNLEEPGRWIRNKSDRPSPVGFGPRPLSHPARQRRAGTYDERWVERHAPGLPPDIDWTFFNVAPEDQWLEQDIAGGERFSLENMHPSIPRLDGRTPRVRARVFVERRDGLEEIALRCDTLLLFPHIEIGVAIHRGLLTVDEDDAYDIQNLLVAAEAPDQPRAASHYAQVLRQRTEGDKRGIHALRDQDLLPPLPAGVDPMGLDELPGSDLIGEEDQLALNLGRDGEAPTPAPGLDDPDAILAQLEAAEAHLAALEAEHRAEPIDRDGARPPREDDDVGYPTWAHHLPPAPRLEDEEARERRREVEAAHAAGASLAQRDLTGADLRGIDLSGADLRGAFLESADLSGALLVGADLRDAVLTDANLSDANLSSANLDEANLGKATLHRTALVGATLREAVITNAELIDADLSGANLDGATVLQLRIRGGRFAGMSASDILIIDGDLAGVDLSGASLKRLVVTGVRLDGAHFSDCDLEEACLIGVSAAEAVFDGARAAGLRILEASRLPRASFRGAFLERANLRGADLEASCFDEARLSEADLSEANLTGASLACVVARRALAVRARLDGATLYGADLMDAVLQNASLRGCDLSQASLFRADLLRVQVDGATRLAGANTDLLRFKERPHVSA